MCWRPRLQRLVHSFPTHPPCVTGPTSHARCVLFLWRGTPYYMTTTTDTMRKFPPAGATCRPSLRLRLSAAPRAPPFYRSVFVVMRLPLSHRACVRAHPLLALALSGPGQAPRHRFHRDFNVFSQSYFAPVPAAESLCCNTRLRFSPAFYDVDERWLSRQKTGLARRE